MMKKTLALLTCLMLLLSLFSCRTNEQEGEATANLDASALSGNDALMQTYESAIKGDTPVFDEDLGVIKLTDYRFPSDNVRLGECDILYKVILDVDGDGVNEYVIQSPNKDHILLRCYQGRVYSYCFDAKSLFNLNTDGSFYWVDSYDLSNCTRGYSRIVLDGASLHIQELYRIKQTSTYDEGDGTHTYFVDGKQITRKAFRDYYDSDCRNQKMAIFSPIDISCAYPISSERACELASDHWGWESGATDGAAGHVYLLNIVVLEMPSGDTPSYRIGCRWEQYHTHVFDSVYAQPPSYVRVYEELIVDALTGEVREP